MARMITYGSAHRLVGEFGDFLAVQLAGHPMTSDGKVGSNFLTVQKELASIVDEQAAVEKELRMARGKLRWVDIEFYDEVKNFQNRVLNLVSFNREDLRYRAYFPGGLTAFGRLHQDRQMEEVAKMLAQLEEDGDEWQPLAPDLQKEYDKMVAAREVVHQYEAQRESLKDREKKVKEEWFVAYRGCHHELQLLFPKNRRVVEAFFLKPVRKKREKTSESGEKTEEQTVTTDGEGGGDGES